MRSLALFLLISYATAAKGAPYQVGIASFYSDALTGNRTASGEPYDPSDKTCAHKKLPFGTVVEVKVLRTGKRAQCRVNDRGPFVKKRIIDLSKGMADELGVAGNSIHKVEVRVVERGDGRRRRHR